METIEYFLSQLIDLSGRLVKAFSEMHSSLHFVEKSEP